MSNSFCFTHGLNFGNHMDFQQKIKIGRWSGGFHNRAHALSYFVLNINRQIFPRTKVCSLSLEERSNDNGKMERVQFTKLVDTISIPIYANLALRYMFSHRNKTYEIKYSKWSSR